MLGNLAKETFNPDENYNDFYAGHSFNPLDERTAFNADLVMPRVAWALDVAKETKAKNVLDLCCLDGFASLTLASKLDLFCYGVDLSGPGIDLANARAEKFKLPAAFVQMPIEELKTALRFDVVLLFEAIEHFKDVDAVMDVIKTHIKPGGTLLVSTPDAEGSFGIPNVQDICHLSVFTHRTDNVLPQKTKEGKPIISLPLYLESQGFTVQENNVWNELIHIRCIL